MDLHKYYVRARMIDAINEYENGNISSTDVITKYNVNKNSFFYFLRIKRKTNNIPLFYNKIKNMNVNQNRRNAIVG